jgi:hypothetical protein
MENIFLSLSLVKIVNDLINILGDSVIARSEEREAKKAEND